MENKNEVVVEKKDEKAEPKQEIKVRKISTGLRGGLIQYQAKPY